MYWSTVARLYVFRKNFSESSAIACSFASVKIPIMRSRCWNPGLTMRTADPLWAYSAFLCSMAREKTASRIAWLCETVIVAKLSARNPSKRRAATLGSRNSLEKD
jgi:hypothetical protein